MGIDITIWISSKNLPFIDALEGFDKPVQSTKPKEDPKPAEASSADVVWSEEFLQQASAEFEKNIRLMMAETGGAAGDDTGFAENLLKVSQEAAAKVFESHPEQGASFAETLKYLAEGTESLQVIHLMLIAVLHDLHRSVLHRLNLTKPHLQKCWKRWPLGLMEMPVVIWA